MKKKTVLKIVLLFYLKVISGGHDRNSDFVLPTSDITVILMLFSVSFISY